MDLEGRRSLINIRLQMLISVFGKRVTDESLEALQRVYCDALENFPDTAITRGFGKAEQELDRFPTPKLMREICNEFMPSTSWRYDFEPAEGKDPETGKPVRILIDPDPSCSRCREPRSAHPVVKIRDNVVFMSCKRYVRSKLGNDIEMFRPQDCLEGRAFLAKLKQIAGSK